jgi:hypothetical protein
MAGHIIETVVKGIADGIGLASEGFSYYKQQKAARQSSSSASPPPYTKSPCDNSPVQEKDEKILFDENDEEQWDLDDAQVKLYPSTNEPPAQTERDVGKITSNIIALSCSRAKTTVARPPTTTPPKRQCSRLHSRIEVALV